VLLEEGMKLNQISEIFWYSANEKPDSNNLAGLYEFSIELKGKNN